MPVRRTFLDTGVLLAAWDANKAFHEHAKSILEDANRDFIATSLLSLELIPHAEFGKRDREVAFMRDYLDVYVSETLEVNEQLVIEGMEVACRIDAGGIDAMHLAAAIRLNADEFITTEKESKPMYNENRLRVVHLSKV
jgi:predicted nucleic acid-binding protein